VCISRRSRETSTQCVDTNRPFAGGYFVTDSVALTLRWDEFRGVYSPRNKSTRKRIDERGLVSLCGRRYGARSPGSSLFALLWCLGSAPARDGCEFQEVFPSQGNIQRKRHRFAPQQWKRSPIPLSTRSRCIGSRNAALERGQIGAVIPGNFIRTARLHTRAKVSRKEISEPAPRYPPRVVSAPICSPLRFITMDLLRSDCWSDTGYAFTRRDRGGERSAQPAACRPCRRCTSLFSRAAISGKSISS